MHLIRFVLTRFPVYMSLVVPVLLLTDVSSMRRTCHPHRLNMIFITAKSISHSWMQNAPHFAAMQF